VTVDAGALRRRIEAAVAPVAAASPAAVAPVAAPSPVAVPARAPTAVPARAPEASAVPPRAMAAPASGRPASLRDDPVANHPLVREASALFDATIVRIEAAGSLPEPGPAAAGGLADALEPGANGDADV
jgi:hypothetical protein